MNFKEGDDVIDLTTGARVTIQHVVGKEYVVLYDHGVIKNLPRELVALDTQSAFDELVRYRTRVYQQKPLLL